MAETSLSDVVKRLKQEGQLTRNSGTNSIKTIKEILVENQRSSLSDKETAREQAVMQDKQLQLMERMAGNTESLGDSLGVSSAGAAGGGGFLGGLLGGAGLGGGALMAGLGILAGGGGYLLSQIGDMDAESIKNNVLSLLSIGDAFTGGNWGFLLEGGAFGLAMAGIGAGLGVFAIGSAAASVAARFEVEGWTTKIKDNVKELLAIKDELGGNFKLLYSGAAFGLAMTGIGAGLAVFGAGSAVAGAAEGLTQFVKADNWAQNIKDRVITLMSISDELGGNGSFVGDSATFLLAMTGIAGGLAIFGAGAAAGGALTGLADGLTWFTGEADFAATIKDRVKTLVSIADDLGGSAAAFGESGTFLATMTGLGLGMAVFGGGAAIAGLAEGISKFTGDDDFATTIKNRVKTLVGITDLLSDGDGDTSKAGMFAAGMAKIGVGLTAFAAGGFVGTLANLGSEILGFFGADKPFDQVMKIADKSDKLTEGANALEKISGALSAFSNIEVSEVDLDFEKLAMNLGRAVPFLDALANGGEVAGSDGWFTSPIVFPKGLLDPSLRLDELAGAAGQVNSILSGGSPSRTQMEFTAERVNSAINIAQSSANEAEDAATSVAGNATVGVDASTRIDQRSDTVYVETDLSARGGGWENMDQSDYIRMYAQ